ncbi:hypothetical protein [Candidatus Pandoraea novymonadis]|uniref:hypothetical protein n=1 Tax=Candidatus Pandoraea novymonadis TaxID=1808959 RepID=UPI001FEAB164|nr:hypothetical protein [Candidatus Pandoraea novymonadis]
MMLWALSGIDFGSVFSEVEFAFFFAVSPDLKRLKKLTMGLGVVDCGVELISRSRKIC